MPSPTASSGISLYIHIPFCLSKCPYCDFNTYQGIEGLKVPYVDGLVRELELWGRLLNHPRVNTIFFGGGTPSYMTMVQIGAVLKVVSQDFQIADQCEITLESNPGDLSETLLDQMLELGVNRLSIGVQSFDDGLLQMLGRRHTAAQAEEAYLLARRAGFSNINLDLMYGLPRQTMPQWESSMVCSVDLRPDHLSLYCLTLEEGTPLRQQVELGHLPEADPDLAADMYTHTRAALKAAGYEQYEISNWAMLRRECVHNMAYWQNTAYLGVGAGAHSSLEGHRFWNVSSPRLYIERSHSWPSWESNQGNRLDFPELARSGPLDGYEIIERKLEMAETMLLGLRLLKGVHAADFQARFGVDPCEVYSKEIEELVEQELLKQQYDVLSLTERGLLLGNQVFMRFL